MTCVEFSFSADVEDYGAGFQVLFDFVVNVGNPECAVADVDQE